MLRLDFTPVSLGFDGNDESSANELCIGVISIFLAIVVRHILTRSADNDQG